MAPLGHARRAFMTLAGLCHTGNWSGAQPGVKRSRVTSLPYRHTWATRTSRIAYWYLEATPELLTGI